MKFERLADQLCKNFTGQVVLRWPQSTRSNHQFSPFRCNIKCLKVGIEIIRNGGMPAYGNSHCCKLNAQPLGIGIKVLATR